MMGCCADTPAWKMNLTDWLRHGEEHNDSQCREIIASCYTSIQVGYRLASQAGHVMVAQFMGLLASNCVRLGNELSEVGPQKALELGSEH